MGRRVRCGRGASTIRVERCVVRYEPGIWLSLRYGRGGGVEKWESRTTGQVSEVPFTDAAREFIHVYTRVLQKPVCGFGEQRRRLIGGQHELEDDIHTLPETALPNTPPTTDSP